MRDHPHHDIEILGGLWGMKMTPKMRLLMNKTFETIFTSSTAFYGSRTQSNHDQILLQKYIWYVEVETVSKKVDWPKIRALIKTHNSYRMSHCTGNFINS